MNPDNNNPFSSTGAGATPNSYGSMSNTNYGTTGAMGTANSMSPASDSLTSAADTLNAAAGLNPNGVSAPGYNQYSTTSSTDTTPQLSVAEGPLTPAAPVPGSIGSVTSVPPVATPESSAMPTFAPAGSTTGSYDSTATGTATNTATTSNMFTPAAGTTGATTAGTTSAATQPYNPFAKDSNKTATTSQTASTGTASAAHQSAPATSATTPSAAMNAAKAAAAGAKGGNTKQPSKLMLILGIALAITTISTIVFIILYIQALNSPKTIQVPPMTNNNNVTTSSVKNLTCTQEATNSEGGATINELIAKYVDDSLDTITLSTTDNYGTPEAAQAAQDAFISQREARLNIAGISQEPFTVAYNIEPSGDISVLKYSISAKADQLNASNAESAFGGFTTVDGEVDTALESIRSNYESVGYVCEESQANYWPYH